MFTVNSIQLSLLFFNPFDNLCFLTGIFSPFAFNVITGMVGFKSPISLLVCKAEIETKM